ncbi:MAG: ABC transporter permease [Desulfobacterales bacterium]|nr:ABC transporter permease [Desulfobacterales bacterium]
MKIFKEMFKANLKELLRDKEGLFWLLAFPIIFIFIFGIIFSGGDGEQTFTIGIVSESSTPVNEMIVQIIDGIDNFKVSEGSKENELAALEKGKRSLVFVLPEVGYQDIMAGKQIEVPIYYDATQTNTNQVLIPVIGQIFSQIENNVTGKKQIFTIKQEAVQAEKLSNFDYILPGILAMSLMQLGLFGSLEFLSLREKKIIRNLGVTPLSRSSLLSSEVLLRMIIALVQTILIISIGRVFFNVTIVGSIFAVTGVVILGGFTFTSLGYMLITFSKSMESGRGILQVVQFPMMFLSGIFFPIEFMPSYIKPVIKALPLTYLGDALRQVMIGTSGYHSMTTNLLVLSAWFVVSLIITIRFWRWD